MKIENKISVLDLGHVEYVSHMGNDLTVANAARVSFNKESDEFVEKDEKLISYLAKHNHWTPFAHPQITLRIKAPIFVRTQLFKHKVGFTENEISRRYDLIRLLNRSVVGRTIEIEVERDGQRVKFEVLAEEKFDKLTKK